MVADSRGFLGKLEIGGSFLSQIFADPFYPDLYSCLKILLFENFSLLSKLDYFFSKWLDVLGMIT